MLRVVLVSGICCVFLICKQEAGIAMETDMFVYLSGDFVEDDFITFLTVYTFVNTTVEAEHYEANDGRFTPGV